MKDGNERWARLRAHLPRGLERIVSHARVLIDADGRVAGWNHGAQRLFGYSEEQALGQANSVFFTAADRRANVPEQELALASECGQVADEHWHVRRDGSRFLGSATVAPIRSEDGVLLGFVKVIRDLTEQHRAADRLAETESRYILLVNSIKDYAIYMLDGAGCVSYWTPAAERIIGYTADEIIGKPFATFFTPEDQVDGLPERELRAAREQGRVEGTGWRVRKNGSRFWGDEIATALFDQAGAFIGYSKITRDATERHEVELERERLLHAATEANRLRDDFLATISHELRTPLNAIIGWLQLLRCRSDVPSHLFEALSVLERNARLQARLIDDLFNASRIVAGREALTLRQIHFSEPLLAAVETLKPSAYQKKVALTVDHDLSADELIGDSERLQQVIWNLLANAIKFTPRGGRVGIRTSLTDTEIKLSVTDTGVGIEPSFLPFVFERFRQADSAPSRTHGGLGLGLSIVKHFVDLHHGDITIASGGPGQGTTVCIRLPRRGQATAPASLDHPATNRASTDLLAGITVLVVDDDPDSRHVLNLALTAHGAQTTVSQSVRDGLAAAHACRPDIVLTDLAMPHQDGFALLSRLRAEPALAAVPVIAVTAHARHEDRTHVRNAGFDGYLAKPVDLNEVIETVCRLTAASGA